MLQPHSLPARSPRESCWSGMARAPGMSKVAPISRCLLRRVRLKPRLRLKCPSTINSMFASPGPLARSKRTAEIIWEAREPQIITGYDLREIDLYSFQGLLKHEGKERFGPVFRQWQVDAPNFNVDGHYPVRELWERAGSCWDKILAHDSSSVLVVAHNAFNQAFVATAIGVGVEYFRILLQSNCGVSVLDFIPRSEGASPHICLNRLNQVRPLVVGKSAVRKTNKQIILVCHGYTQGNAEDGFLLAGDQQLNMLGVIQSQKSALLLLDLKVNSIISRPNKACIGTANTISQVQEAAHCLGADCVPRYAKMKQLENLYVGTIFQQSKARTYHLDVHPYASI